MVPYFVLSQFYLTFLKNSYKNITNIYNFTYLYQNCYVPCMCQGELEVQSTKNTFDISAHVRR